MSKYPLGPWTRLTPGDVTLMQSRSKYVDVSGSVIINAADFGSHTNTVYREGYNSGHRSDIVQHSVRDDKFLESIPCHLISKRTGTQYGLIEHSTVYSVGSTNMPSIDTNLLSKLTTNTLAKIGPRARQRAAMLGVTLGEGQKTARETQRLLAQLVDHHNTAASNAYAKMQKLWRGLPKTRKSAQRFARELADNYLNYHLGIKPLVSDIDSLLKATADLEYSKVKRGHKFSATSKEVKRLTETVWTNQNYDGFIVDVSILSHSYGIVKIGGTFTTEDEVPGFASRFGLTNNDVIPTIEELIPYSWLVDYGTNLSQVCEVAAFPRTAVKDMWIVKIYNETRKQRVTRIDYDGVWSYGETYSSSILDSGMVTKKRFSYTRDSFDISGYIPMIQLELPDFRQLSIAGALLASKVFKPRLDKSVDKALQPSMLFHYQRYLRDAHSFKY